MKVEVDTTSLESALRERLCAEGQGAVIVTELCGKEMTSDDLLDELDSNTPLAEELLQSFAKSSLRIWALRGGHR